MVFDAVAIIVSEQGCEKLLTDGAATDFAKNAFGHLKAIGFSKEAWPLGGVSAIAGCCHSWLSRLMRLSKPRRKSRRGAKSRAFHRWHRRQSFGIAPDYRQQRGPPPQQSN